MTVPFHVAPGGHPFNGRSRRRPCNCGVYQRRRRGRCARTRTLRNAKQLQSNLHSRRYLLARAIHPGSATKNPVSDAQPSAGVPSLRYTARWHIPMVEGIAANTDMNWRLLTCVPVFVFIEVSLDSSIRNGCGRHFSRPCTSSACRELRNARGTLGLPGGCTLRRSSAGATPGE